VRKIFSLLSIHHHSFSPLTSTPRRRKIVNRTEISKLKKKKVIGEKMAIVREESLKTQVFSHPTNKQ